MAMVACMRKFITNLNLLIKTDHSEAIHVYRADERREKAGRKQLRVAKRRTVAK